MPPPPPPLILTHIQDFSPHFIKFASRAAVDMFLIVVCGVNELVRVRPKPILGYESRKVCARHHRSLASSSFLHPFTHLIPSDHPAMQRWRVRQLLKALEESLRASKASVQVKVDLRRFPRGAKLVKGISAHQVRV